MTGFYVHVPFCKRHCHYCNFTITTSDVATAGDRFLQALSLEADRYRDRFQGTAFETLYLGGGTPGLLPVPQIERLFGLLRERFRFQDDAEITLEVNPGDVTAEKAWVWKDLGVTRLSLGAQTFEDRTLERLNRAHTSKDIADSFSMLRESGFGNINLDLMLSLPGEAERELERSLEAVALLHPEHISLYELVIEKDTVFDRWMKTDRLADLPSEEAQLRLLSLARDFLKKRGWGHYELLNYSKPGFESRHNLLYWANRDYLGLGPGAFSYFDGRRYRFSDTVEEYFRKIEAGDQSVFEEETLPAEKRETESFLLALRLSEGADSRRFKDLLTRLAEPLKTLQRDGLVEAGERVRLTPRGQLFAESVFSLLC